MNFFSIFFMLIISFILSAIITAIFQIQLQNFFNEIGLSKYIVEKKILDREFETNDTKKLDKYINKAMLYTTIFIFIIIFLFFNDKFII